MRRSVLALFAFLLFFSTVSFSVLIFMGSPLAYAQDGGEDFFDPEEEYYEDEYVEEDAPDTTNSDGGSARGTGRNRPGNNKPTFDTSGLNMGGGGGGSYPSETVEFKLVNPPKYWTPKKRKLTKPPPVR